MIVRTGTWLYDGATPMPVDIIALPYNFWHELAQSSSDTPPEEEPASLNSDGQLLYVRFRNAGSTTTQTWPDSPGFRTLAEAVEHAESRVPTTISWH